MMRLFAACVLCAICATAAPRWEMQYFLDADDKELVLTDLCFPSAQRGLAAGWIVRGRRQQPVVVVTSNGGANWVELPASEPARSLFCLDETACWMVTPKGIWFSDETGRSWRKVKRESALLSVYFLTRERGWALGARKKVLETRDGGKTWTKLGAAEALRMSPERAVFHSMTFLTAKNGLLTARSEPVVMDDIPAWMDPDASLRRERPTLTAVLETRDGGNTWTGDTTSMFGRISNLSAVPGGKQALGLIEFERVFAFPSEVYRFDTASGKQARILRRKDLAVTDIGVGLDGTAVAAGFEPTGALVRSPVPGKVRVYESSAPFDQWIDHDADYRAVAHRVHLAVVDRDNMWIATDTGMILKLNREPHSGAAGN